MTAITPRIRWVARACSERFNGIARHVARHRRACAVAEHERVVDGQARRLQAIARRSPDKFNRIFPINEIPIYAVIGPASR